MTRAELRKKASTAKKAMNAATRKHFSASKKVQKATQTLAQWNYEVNHWYHESHAQKKKLDAALEALAALPKGRRRKSS